MLFFFNLQLLEAKNKINIFFVKKSTEKFCTYSKTSYLCNAFEKRNVAQLVAHYVRDVGVGRSSRLIPTESVNNENCLPFLFYT